MSKTIERLEARYRAMKKRRLRILLAEYTYLASHAGSGNWHLQPFCQRRVRMLTRILDEKEQK